MAQPQQDHPKGSLAEPVLLLCLPAAVAGTSAFPWHLCLSLAPLPSLGLGTFHLCTEGGVLPGDGVGVLLQLCSSATERELFSLPCLRRLHSSVSPVGTKISGHF